MPNINRKHKDRLFSFLFGNSDHKDWTLSLYNAVNSSCYDNPDDIQITTMGSVVYMGMKNDVSFIISDMLNIYEQQSSFNPNMPIRLLMYAARLYDKYIHGIHGNIYGSSLVRLPQPKLLVFYNGPQERADTVLRLSDAFRVDSGGQNDAVNGTFMDNYDIEVCVRMLNINYGHNQDLMGRCVPLCEYAWLVDRIRGFQAQRLAIADAVDLAIDDMPDGWLIKPCLLANRAEVKNMCITEYNEAETMQLFKEEGRVEGRKEGRVEGRKEGRVEGRKEGEDKLGKLIALLLANGLTDDARLAALDKSARAELYRKYGID